MKLNAGSTRIRLLTTLNNLSAHSRIQSSLPRFSLSDFLLRQRVLKLWRDIMRTTNKIPKISPTRTELKRFAREEFERNRTVTDPVKIRYLVSTGKTQAEKIKEGMDI